MRTFTCNTCTKTFHNLAPYNAPILRCSHGHYESTLYLNLYEKHFSYIKDDEGVIVTEEARTTFDLDSYFDKGKAEELKSTEKLNWQSAHLPLNASVCSNVPDLVCGETLQSPCPGKATTTEESTRWKTITTLIYRIKTTRVFSPAVWPSTMAAIPRI